MRVGVCGACRESLSVAGVSLLLPRPGLMSLSFHRKALFMGLCLAWERADGTSVYLPFLSACFNASFFITALHPGAITSHLESLALVKVHLHVNSCLDWCLLRVGSGRQALKIPIPSFRSLLSWEEGLYLFYLHISSVHWCLTYRVAQQVMTEPSNCKDPICKTLRRALHLVLRCIT